MNFIAQMRLGSVELLGALAFFVALGGRGHANKSPSQGGVAPQRITLEIDDHGSRRTVEGYCPFTIGRASSADLLLADPAVSRIHARLENEGRTVFLTDFSSSNGTYLNGERMIDSIELRSGDTIDIGEVRITFLGARSWE